MSFLSKRSFSTFSPAPVDTGTSTYKLTKGMIEAGIVLSVFYSVNVTAVGLAVRSRSLPVRRIILAGDDGVTLQVWRAADLISMAQVFEQAATGAMIVPASGFAVANYPNLEAHIPLQFEQRGPKIREDIIQTALPTFGYGELTLTVEWGAVTDILTGTPTGTITIQSAVVTQLDYADLNRRVVDPRALVQRTPRAVNRYLEVTQAAVATNPLEIDIGNSANIRGLLITAEGSNGEPTNGIISTVSLQEDNQTNIFTNVPWATLRADNAKHFGVTMPTGVAVIDFAEDGNFAEIYNATLKNKVRLQFSTLAVAGTIRAELLTIIAPKQLVASGATAAAA